MKKILFLLLLCFSFFTLIACENNTTVNRDSDMVVRAEEGIMNDIIDSIKSVFD